MLPYRVNCFKVSMLPALLYITVLPISTGVGKSNIHEMVEPILQLKPVKTLLYKNTKIIIHLLVTMINC